MLQQRTWSLAQQARFYHQVAKSLDAGLSLSQTLRLVQNQVPRSQRQNLQQASQRIAQGQSLAKALQSTSFDRWTLRLIQMAEYSGALPILFTQLARQCEAQTRQQRQLRSASFSVLMLVASLILITAVLVGLSGILTGLILLLSSSGFWLIIATPAGEPWRWQLPILRSLTEANAMLQLTYLAIPLRCGVSVLAAVELLSQAVPNQRLQVMLYQALPKLKQGRSLQIILQPHIPAIASQYLKTGEATGQLDELLDRLATHYEQQLEHQIYRLQAIL
ncbi:MAG: type II secretion system F family protein, partial [Cyanobacteria bacterium P01_H01_bin.121]